MDTNLVLELLRAQTHIGDALAVAATGDPERPDRFVLRKIRAANERLEIAAQVAGGEESPAPKLRSYTAKLEKRTGWHDCYIVVEAYNKREAWDVASKTVESAHPEYELAAIYGTYDE